MKNLVCIICLFAGMSTLFAQDEKAVSYKTLQEHLPSSISGFTASGDPDGQSMSMNGMSYSMASQEYENGSKSLRITIMDYHGAGSLYNAAAMAWTMNMEFEDDDQKVSGFKEGDFHGLVSVQKKRTEVNITTGFRERYYVQVEIEGSDDEAMARKILKGLKLSDLP